MGLIETAFCNSHLWPKNHETPGYSNKTTKIKPSIFGSFFLLSLFPRNKMSFFLMNEIHTAYIFWPEKYTLRASSTPASGTKFL
jgi:hypothetical protein